MSIVTETIPATLLAESQTFCRTRRITLANYLYATWVVVLRWYTGDDYIASVFSTQVSDTGFALRNNNERTLESFQATNPQVVGVYLSDEDTLFKICEKLDLEHDSTTQLAKPLKRIHFFEMVYGNEDREAEEPESLLKGLGLNWESAKHDCLSVRVCVSAHNTYITITTHSPRCLATLATHIANTFIHILAIAVSNFNLSIKDITLSNQYTIATLRQWNSPPPSADESTIPQCIYEQTIGNPNKLAVIAWDGELDYIDLDNRASRLAHHLTKMGVTSGCIVPFCFEKSTWVVVATLAILKAGAAFVPIDPGYSQSRIKEIFERSSVKLALVSAKCYLTIAGLVEQIVIVSQKSMTSLQAPQRCHYCVPIEPNDLAFVLFTSSSTGRPKGVVQEHRSVCTVSKSYAQTLHLNADSRVLQFASHVFDVFTVDVFATLIAGGCVCIPSEWERRNDIVKAMNDMRVTWADLTPSLVSVIKPEEVKTLETLVLAGEEVKPSLVQQWKDKVRLINCYGPAEAGGVTALEYQSDAEVTPSNIIGYQLPSARCWIADPDDYNRLMPIGYEGEILVSGPTLARGYLEDETRTSAVFVKPHFAQEMDGPNHWAKFYRTGDLARQLPNGAFVFLGRRDNQVKVRGQKVELGEIETCITAYPGIIKSVALFPRSGRHSDQIIVVIEKPLQESQTTQPQALQCPSAPRLEGTCPDTDAVLTFVSEHLPSYMVPTTIYVMDSIPLSISQKIDRKAVLSWVAQQNGTSANDMLIDVQKYPRLSVDDETSYRLSNYVIRMLVGTESPLATQLVHLDFCPTAYGLDSIRAVTLSRWIEKDFGAKIAVERLVDAKATISSVASLIKQGSLSSDISSAAKTKALLHRVDQLWATLKPSSFSSANSNSRPKQLRNVFLTGATGYLGIHILMRLLANPIHEVVTTLVRAPNRNIGYQRLFKAAEAVSLNLHLERHIKRLEVWCGDLSLPYLGLHESHWKRLQGNDSSCAQNGINSIIHAGAIVKWNADYDNLQTANVLSTLQLLEIATRSRTLNHFAFVSGGQRLRFEDENIEGDVAEEVALSHGYAQTKFVSECLVRRFAAEGGFSDSGLCIRVIKPSFIIGSAEKGVANTADYLWRLLAGAAEIGSYNEDDEAAWVFVSDVETVARKTIDSMACNDAQSSTAIKILDGIVMRDLWHILGLSLKRELQPVPGVIWWQMLRQHVESKGESHCLWPLLHILDPENGILSSKTPAKVVESEPTVEIRAALLENMKYLQSSGFLAKTRHRL